MQQNITAPNERPLQVPRSVVDELERVCTRCSHWDREACGALSGPLAEPELVDACLEMENEADRYHTLDPKLFPRTARDSFRIHSLHFERVAARESAQGRALKVLFHSHLDAPAVLSSDDLSSMSVRGRGSPLAFWVVALSRRKVVQHRLFVRRRASDLFVESPFAILGR